MLLGVLGVDEQTILDEYELTSTYSTPRRIAELRAVLDEHEVPEDRVRPLLEARRPVMLAALKHLREGWDTFDGYETGLGVDPSVPDQLRAALLVYPEVADTIAM